MITTENLVLKSAYVKPQWTIDERTKNYIKTPVSDDQKDHLKVESWVHEAINFLQLKSQELNRRPLSEEAVFYGSKLALAEWHLQEFKDNFFQRGNSNLTEKDLRKETHRIGYITSKIYQDTVDICCQNGTRHIDLLDDVLLVRNLLTTEHNVAFMGDLIAAHVQKRILKRSDLGSSRHQHPKAWCYHE